MTNLIMTSIDATKGFVKAAADDGDKRLGNAYIRHDELEEGKTVDDIEQIKIVVTYKK